ncbi:MAG TPA: glycosyltransferase family 2 protein [Longimicrobiaceae bacterium]|nr:glycosyltransferase family 2 protein [Longimicrobiaceae bacterium]
MSVPRITAVVVAYRSRGTIEATLTALRPAYEEGLLACTVVDNHGGDGTHELVVERFPWVRAIRGEVNLGFARGNNLGLAGVESAYVLFLNPDASIGAEALRRMADFMDANPRVGVVGPAILNNGMPGQPAGLFPTPRAVIREAALGKRSLGYFIDPGAAPYPADWVCGAVMLVRRELLDRLGGFDPRFFLYFEETDLCYRARKLGYETWTLGEAVAEHRPGSSAEQESGLRYRGCIAEHYFRSRFYYFRKHYGWTVACGTEAAELVLLLLRAIRRKVRGTGRVGELTVRFRAPVFRQPAVPRR